MSGGEFRRKQEIPIIEVYDMCPSAIFACEGRLAVFAPLCVTPHRTSNVILLIKLEQTRFWIPPQHAQCMPELTLVGALEEVP